MLLIPQSQCFNVCSISKTGSYDFIDTRLENLKRRSCVSLNLHHIQHRITIVISRCLGQVLLSIERDIELKWCDLMSKVRLDPRTKLNTLFLEVFFLTPGRFSDNFQDRYLKGVTCWVVYGARWSQIEFQTTKATVTNLPLRWDLEAIWCNLDQFDTEAGPQILGQR